ncbi:MAG TPA: serpin family protein, partial [Labilithrix sp.]
MSLRRCALVLGLVACGSPREAPNVPPVTTAQPPDTAEPAVIAPAVATSAADAGAFDDVRAGNAFATKIFAQVKRAPGNMLVSGTSVREALAIPYLGARGDTAREMASVLELPADASALVKTENAQWQEAKGQSELTIASKLWVEKTAPLRADFVAGAPVEAIDFLHAADDARRAIDKWADDATAHHIPHLVPAGTIDARTRMVVTNAVYMKARWSTPFEASATKDEPFHVDGHTTKNVPTMHATETRGYAEIPGAKIVQLAYRGSDLAMTIVLHDDPNDESIPEDAMRALATRRVSLAMPRFKFESGADLGSVLAELGMRAPMSMAADFSGMTEKRDVAIGAVVHKTWIAVDEQGTEAAAATAVVMRATSLIVGPVVEVKLDRPFLFLVRDVKRGRILFVGRVTDPTPKG